MNKQQKQKLGFNIILLGQITAGKDTQANILMEKYALKPVESGKHWRTLMKAKTPEGEWLRRTTAKGHPAPVALMKKFLIKNLEGKPKNKDLIFIGNPRLKPEAQLLSKLFEEQGQDFIAFYIDLPDAEIYRRTAGRKDGNMKEVYKALDKDKKIIENRIKWHKEQVSKSVAYFKSLGKLKRIRGKQSIPDIAALIEKEVQKHLNK